MKRLRVCVELAAPKVELNDRLRLLLLEVLQLGEVGYVVRQCGNMLEQRQPIVP